MELCDTVAGANIVFTMHIKKTLFIAPLPRVLITLL
jgi:hypothetical protein